MENNFNQMNNQQIPQPQAQPQQMPTYPQQPQYNPTPDYQPQPQVQPQPIPQPQVQAQPQPTMPNYPKPGQPTMPSYPQPGQPVAPTPLYQEQSYDYNYGSAYQPSYTPTPKVEDSSILVLGILSLVFNGIVAIILSNIGLNKARGYGIQNLVGSAKVGATLCKVGRILGIITLIISIAYFIIYFLAIGISFMDSSYNYMSLLMPFLF